MHTYRGIYSNDPFKEIILFGTLLLAGFFPVYSQSPSQDDKASTRARVDVVLRSEVDWGPLNPARGDASPRAGTLWGDRTTPGPSGFLVQFKDGFSSPPHIHNVTYRGLVIRGLIHNDDPEAENMWLSPGSYWTQPAGDSHITSAKGSTSLAYIEIEDGPYLVKPTKEAFDNGEQAINADVSNLVWLAASDLTWIDPSKTVPAAQSPLISLLWGSTKHGEMRGILVKLPAGFKGEIRTMGSTFHAVVIRGVLSHRRQGSSDAKNLEPASYFGSSGEALHRVSNQGDSDVMIYIRTNETYKVR